MQLGRLNTVLDKYLARCQCRNGARYGYSYYIMLLGNVRTVSNDLERRKLW